MSALGQNRSFADEQSNVCFAPKSGHCGKFAFIKSFASEESAFPTIACRDLDDRGERRADQPKGHVRRQL